MGYIHKVDLEPVALPGENIVILPDNKPFRVAWIEPLPAIDKDFGSLAAGAETGDTEVTDVYTDENQLVQFRIIPLDDVEVTVKQPRAKGRWVTKVVQAKLIKDNPHDNLAEMFQFEDRGLFFNVKNPTSYTLPASRVRLVGFRFVLEPLSEMPEKKTYVVVGGNE
ncbi:MAG: hypothetical protein DRP12_00025 [Candidatus Aenigmatarchaeota archaeon]|nr:MAG: hypothetical protein DRP12_00025 [Candidatus Aenigmarchaeota archaeon]